MAKFIANKSIIHNGQMYKPGSEITINKADKVDTDMFLEKGYISEPSKADSDAGTNTGDSGE